MSAQLDELISFIEPNARLDVKTLALHHVLSMTGDAASRNLLVFHKTALNHIVTLAFKKDEQKSINKDAFFTLINLSADEMSAKKLIEQKPNVIRDLIEYVADETSRFADTACAVLSNLSRGKLNSQRIYDCLKNENDEADEANNNNSSESEFIRSSISFKRLLQIFCTENYNKDNKLDYLGPFICNLTQLDSVRDLILNDKLVLLRLLPYTTYLRSSIRRGGIVGSIKNCAFAYDKHEMLIFDPEIDILSRLLLPLAGPEEFDEEENDKLPEDLQYLPPDKERESDPDIRIMLLETLLMLTSHKKCRLHMKEKNVYLILRELHKWERDESVLAACEKIVQVLIGDEPEPGMETIHQVVVPENLSKKFYEHDQKELEKNFE